MWGHYCRMLLIDELLVFTSSVTVCFCIPFPQVVCLIFLLILAIIIITVNVSVVHMLRIHITTLSLAQVCTNGYLR